jgi:ribose transport system ATP-binding protein
MTQVKSARPVGAPILEVQNLSKTFPGQRALQNVSIEVRRGEVLALLGENGSGKSTLVKVLSAYHSPDEGADFLLDGVPADIESKATQSRIRFVHQRTALVDELSILENLCLGRGFLTKGGILIDWKREAKLMTARLADFGCDLPVSTPVAQLTRAERAVVTIVRAVEGWEAAGGILVLDEPTAFLPSEEVDRLLDTIRKLRADGAGILFISHHLEDVFAVADRAVVLRDGRLVAERRVVDTDEGELITDIVGQRLSKVYPDAPMARANVVLSVRDLEAAPITGLSFDLHEGEILGVTGQSGSGQDTLSAALFGAEKPQSGSVILNGKEIFGSNPRQSVRAGIAFVPANRAEAGVVPEMSVRDNVTLADVPSVTRWGVMLSKSLEQEALRPWTERLRLTPGAEERMISLLSGGNQQKAVLAKWMRRKPKILLLDEPTNGVDIATKTTIFELVGESVSHGAAAIVCSMNAIELAETCDRVLVLYGGRLFAELVGEDLTPHSITAASLGQN